MRRIDFDFDADEVPPNWYGGDAHLTTFWNALSLLFPEGERFFVESVRRYQDRLVDPELRAAVEGFVGQEAMHGKEHRAFNDLVSARGLPAKEAEQQLKRLLAFGRRMLGPRARLGVTCALEHMTAIMAEQLLSVAEHRDSAHPSVRALWVWHALEESEHKAVAFDVYRAVGGTYGARVRLMALATAFFFGELLLVHVRLLAAQGELSNLRGWARALDTLWLRPGLLRRLVPAYLDYFRPGFHPEQRDTNALRAEWAEILFGARGELREKLRAA